MININLLPPELKLRRIQVKHNASLASVCVVFVIIFIVLGIISLAAKNTLETYLGASKHAVTQNTTPTKDSGDLENLALLINDRAKATTELEKNRAIWSQILLDLAKDIPIDVQIDNFTANAGKQPNFNLQGNTVNEREIIKFKDKLENSGFFKNVAFKNSSLAQDQKVSFTLEFDLEKYSEAGL